MADVIHVDGGAEPQGSNVFQVADVDDGTVRGLMPTWCLSRARV